jgi:electron transport complex protein RnfD
VEETGKKEVKESLDEVSPRFVVSSSPHVHAGTKIGDLMKLVIISLLPAALFSIYVFGVPALVTIVISMGSAVLFEAAWLRMLKRPVTVGNLSAVLTGLLLALNLPSTSPWWMILVGTFFAIVIAKQIYGGLGNNLFNPALVGRVVLLIAFPLQMTAKWAAPRQWGTSVAELGRHGADSLATISTWGANAVTTATPLGRVREALLTTGRIDVHLTRREALDLLIGNRAGSLGEVSVVLLLAGGIFLLAKRVITWHTPVAYIGSVWLLTGVFHLVNPARYADPSFHVITGGLFLGAFFMATDYVTSPIAARGKLIFGAGCGLFTVIIRLFGSYPEGVSFAILLMNAVTPLIDRYTGPVVFGMVKAKKERAQSATRA